MNYGYIEDLKSLTTRIKSYNKYSNEQLNKWIMDIIKPKKSEIVLDIGCGTGYQTKEFAKRVKKVIGIDSNREILQDTINKNKNHNIEYIHHDFNTKFDWIEKSSFDIISSCYSVYYANNINSLILEMKRLLTNKGRIFICGPARINSLNLYRLHDLMANSNVTNTAYIRSSRIYNEVIPALGENFKHLEISHFYNTLSFPDTKSFSEYYKSTLLFEENVRGKDYVLRNMIDYIEKYIKQFGKYEIHKVAIGILAYGKDFRSEF